MKRITIVLSMILVLALLSVSITPVLAESVTDLDENIVESSKNKISESLTEKMETVDESKKIQVVIWYNDINQSFITRQAEIKATTILKKQYPDINQSLISTVIQAKEKNPQIGENHNIFTDDICRAYISSRRSISVQQYQKVSKSIISDGMIYKKDIVFNSRYAPMLIVNLTPNEIKHCSKLPSIVAINEFTNQKSKPCSIDSVLTNISVPSIDIDSDWELSGDNIKVGMVDTNFRGILPNGVNLNNDTYITRENNGTTIHDYGSVAIISPYDTDINSHGYYTAEMILSIAPNIKLYYTGRQNSSQIFNDMEVMIDEGVNLINFSMWFHVSIEDPNYDYTTIEKWMDHIISYHDVMIIVAAGNQGTLIDEDSPRVTCPGLANNVITVGAFEEFGSNSRVPNNLDTLMAYSSYQNRIDGKEGVEKPDVVMPTTNSTSYAAPVLTGILALMLQLDYRLKTNPLALKAITLASCHRKAQQYTCDVDAMFITGEQEHMEDGITEKQGAGVPDARIMANIICQGTYGVGTITEEKHHINIEQASYNASNMNISLVWFRENTINNDHSNIIQVGDAHNLDLAVKNNNTIKVSEKVYSSTEMCYFPISTTDFKHQIEITNMDDSLSNIKFGYAWSTNSSVNTPDFQYGAYYIRNAETNKYLTYNTAGDTSILKLELKTISNQNSFSQNHIWVMNNQDCTSIKAAPDTDNIQLGISTSIYDNNIRYAKTTNTDKVYYPIKNSDGTFSILYTNGSNIYALSYCNDSVVWKYTSGTNEITISEKWYFDKANYLIMDTNTDGYIDTADATFIQRSMVGLETPTNLQLYLGDINKNGELDIFDVHLLLNFLT